MRQLRLVVIALLIGVSANASRFAAAAEVAGSAFELPPDIAATAPVGRLPDLARPLAYRLDLRLDPRADGFAGSVAIDLELARATRVIWLHGRDLRVSAVRARLPEGRRLEGHYAQALDSGVAALYFDEELPAGALTVTIEYAAAYNRNLAGLFKVEEQGDAYVLAKSESIQARRFLPGFDEPGMKAPFELSLTVPAGYPAITNSPEIGRSPAGDGMERVRFAPTRPMPTYLLSLAVGPFEVVERPPLAPNEVRSEPVPLRGIARRGRGAELAYILDRTPEMVAVFERQLGQPYPFAKLDIVAAPQWPSGATELSAAITYREQIILAQGAPPPGGRLRLVNIHAHELAHMWFGNLVTPPWWDDLWLKEGFATWGSPLALTLLEPGAGHAISAAERAIGAMQLDSLASTRAIREPVQGNDEVRNAYDAITYSKSLGVIHMVDDYFGSAVFRPALGRYLRQYADGSADSPQFYRVIGDETGTPALAEVFRGFVEQQGLPLLRARLDCDGNGSRLQVRQERYRPLGSPIAGDPVRWSIPLCVRDDRGERLCTMLREPAATLELPNCPRWVLPNAAGAGYFRWTVPPDQWSALLQDFDALDATEALSLVDSAFAAFEAGELDPQRLWQVIEASSAAPWRQVVTAPLDYLERYVEHYFDPAQRRSLMHRLRQWYGPVLARTAGSDDPEERLLYASLLQFSALSAGDPDARARLQAQAVAFTGFGGPADPAALDSDLYEAALTVAVQDLGKPFILHLIELRGALDDPRFESASANALGRTTDPALLPLIRALALDPVTGPREAFGLLHAALATEPVRAENWRWLESTFPEVLAKVPDQWRRRTPEFAASFCTPEKAAELGGLFRRYGELAPGHGRSLDQTLERLRLCVALSEGGRAFAGALQTVP